MKVVFCIPSLHGPSKPLIAALEASLPLIQAAGFEEGAVEERGCPYISYARATMLRKALDAKADMVVFLDYDLSWRPPDLLKLIETEGDVVAGTYRFKKEPEEYMGGWFLDGEGRPVTRESDGALKSTRVPAGFLKITTEGVHKFMQAYPELTYGVRYNPTTDLFSHGVIDGVWFGEDMAFSKRWTDKYEPIVLVPDLGIDHHSGDQVFPGNLHEYLLRLPGGSKHGTE